jgi:hypothetical protein
MLQKDGLPTLRHGLMMLFPKNFDKFLDVLGVIEMNPRLTAFFVFTVIAARSFWPLGVLRTSSDILQSVARREEKSIRVERFIIHNLWQ